MEYYVYIYLDPRKPPFTKDNLVLPHEPFYIGKGKGKRAWMHLKESQAKNSNNRLKKGKLERIKASGFQPIILFYRENLEEPDAMVLEAELIKTVGTKWNIKGIPRGPLTNMTSGGDGWSPAEELRERYSRKGPDHYMWGRKLTPEQRKSMGDRRRGRPHPKAVKDKLSKTRSYGGADFRGKTWRIILPNGKEEFTDNLPAFCEQKKLPYGSLYGSFVRGKPISRCQFKGYQLQLIPVNGAEGAA